LTYSRVDGPSGLAIGPSGLVNWTPSESQGPSTNTVSVRVTDSGIPPLATTNTFQIVVLEVNSPPALVAPANQVIDEGQAFLWNLQGTDGDLPPQALTYALIQGPLGMSVTPEGVVTWTPSELQGPSTNEVSIRIADDGLPSLSATVQFQLVVREVNRAPVWQDTPEQSVDEGAALTLNLAAGDPDLPYQALTYSLLSGPSGLAVSALGTLTWTPSESQGPSSNTVMVRVVDDGEPPLAATNQFRVVVREVNSMPVLASIADQSAVAAVPWTLALEGTDRDLPIQTLTYTLLSGPLGLSVTTGGMVDWTPSEAQAPSTNTVTVRLSDDGLPPLSSTADFVVVVRSRDEVPELSLSVPTAGGPMVLKIRGKNGQGMALENASVLGQWSEAQRLTGLGMDTPIQVTLPAVLLDDSQFWRIRIVP
ncbi:MAG: Ig-like domain-containing protein, partial [Desulfobacterales bacterium]|nr:Ig-like domain-containing protein [Desulfobacterales bacterium]